MPCSRCVWWNWQTPSTTVAAATAVFHIHSASVMVIVIDHRQRFCCPQQVSLMFLDRKVHQIRGTHLRNMYNLQTSANILLAPELLRAESGWLYVHIYIYIYYVILHPPLLGQALSSGSWLSQEHLPVILLAVANDSSCERPIF